MFAVSVTILEIFPIEMPAILTLNLKWAKVECKSDNGKVTCDFLFAAIAMLDLSVTDCDIFIVEMRMTLTLIVGMGQGMEWNGENLRVTNV